MVLSRREFLGEETWLRWNTEYEALRAFRNAVSKRRPTEAELMELRVNKVFEDHYRRVL